MSSSTSSLSSLTPEEVIEFQRLILESNPQDTVGQSQPVSNLEPVVSKIKNLNPRERLPLTEAEKCTRLFVVTAAGAALLTPVSPLIAFGLGTCAANYLLVAVISNLNSSLGKPT
jgi:hypothetical protein